MNRSPRDRRLEADALGIGSLVSESSILVADGKGSPPNQYRFRFNGPGLALDGAGNVIIQKVHEVIVDLGAAYPRMMPTLNWRTPIFHPNISNNGVVCLGGYGTHWVPSLTLAELCSMLWDMIRMKNFDVNSPYNREAALWIREQTVLKLPLDPRPIRDRVKSSLATETSDDEILTEGIEVIRNSEAEKAANIIFID